MGQSGVAIGELSRRTGCNIETIRYYERIGLIPPVTRNQSGIRDFTEREIGLLEFVRCFRKAGVSVEALIDYVTLLEEGEGTEEARLAILKEQAENLDARLEELRAARERLSYKIDNYQEVISRREMELFD